jgi:hypothetical protein
VCLKLYGEDISKFGVGAASSVPKTFNSAEVTFPNILFLFWV